MEGGAITHNFERDPPKDHPRQVWFNLFQMIQRRRFKCGSLWHTMPEDGCQVMAKAPVAFGHAN